MFTQKATLVKSEPANNENILPSNKNKGAPGGCGTWSLKAQAINSPQSQKEAVGSTVVVKTNKEMAKTTQPVRSLILLKLFIMNSLQPQKGSFDNFAPLEDRGLFWFLWQ